MKRNYAFLLALLGLLAAPAFAKKYDLETERDIREAAFRYQFNHNISGLQKKAAFYFLFVDPKRRDPSDEFMQRFKDFKPIVKKVSESTRGEGSQVQDRATGKKGLIFYTSDLKWISASKAEIEAGYDEANLSGGSNTYIMVKKSGKWTVAKDIEGPVS